VSDHADFPGLLSAIEASGATRVLVTHGFSDVLSRYLCERGLDAKPLLTRFTGEAPPDAAMPDEDTETIAEDAES
jgi:putative mRNA 3-end processing factor